MKIAIVFTLLLTNIPTSHGHWINRYCNSYGLPNEHTFATTQPNQEVSPQSDVVDTKALIYEAITTRIHETYRRDLCQKPAAPTSSCLPIRYGVSIRDLARLKLTYHEQVKTLGPGERIRDQQRGVYKLYLEKRVVYSQTIHRLLLEAAQAHDAQAQFCLAEVYFDGVGIEIDLLRAYAWAHTAHAQSSPAGDVLIDRIARVMTEKDKQQGLLIGEFYIKNFTDISERSSTTLLLY